MELQRDSQIKHFACEEGFPSSGKCFPRIFSELAKSPLKARHSIQESKVVFSSNAMISPKIDSPEF